METAVALLGNAHGGFDWSNEAEVVFQIVVQGEVCPVRTVIDFLCHAKVVSVAPSDSDLATNSWGVPTRRLATTEHDFPFPIPSSAATLPAQLKRENQWLVIQHWGEGINRTAEGVIQTGRDNTKFWAGAGGYPGVALALDALRLIQRQPEHELFADPFNVPAQQSSSFRFDWRRDYVPLDIGFSLNAHGTARFQTLGYPLVEILAAIGLANARPKFISKLQYHYGVISPDSECESLDIVFLRAALGTTSLPFDQRVFQMNLGWPGKEGQARCITTVEEITNRN